MGSVLSFGIALILALQAHGAWLFGAMKLFSLLGSEPFFTLFVPLIYWCIDEALGLRLAFMLLGSIGLNELLKLPAHGPRPYWISSEVHAVGFETSFGVPSGHSQISAAFWGTVAVYAGKTWVWAATLCLVALVGISRLILGVHFPHDVLFGWAAGFLTLWAFVKLWNPIADRVKQMSAGKQVALSFAVAMGMMVPGLLLVWLSRDWVIPAAWAANATAQGGGTPAPLSPKLLVAASGTLFGQCLGLIVMSRRGGFSAAGSTRQRVLRFIVGIIGVLIIALGLKAILPGGDTALPMILRHVRYVILGFWVTGGAVWTFGRLGLSQSQQA